MQRKQQLCELDPKSSCIFGNRIPADNIKPAETGRWCCLLLQRISFSRFGSKQASMCHPPSGQDVSQVGLKSLN